MRISDWSSDVCSSDLFRISENMLNRGSDIANDTVRHDNHRGAKGVGQEVAKPLFLLQHAELARSIAKVQQRYLTIVVQHVTLLENLDRKSRTIRSEEHTSELHSIMSI